VGGAAATPRDVGSMGEGWAGTIGMILAICQGCGLGRLRGDALGPAGARDGGEEIIPAPPLSEGRVVVVPAARGENAGDEQRAGAVEGGDCAACAAAAVWTRAAWLPVAMMMMTIVLVMMPDKTHPPGAGLLVPRLLLHPAHGHRPRLLRQPLPPVVAGWLRRHLHPPGPPPADLRLPRQLSGLQLCREQMGEASCAV